MAINYVINQMANTGEFSQGQTMLAFENTLSEPLTVVGMEVSGSLSFQTVPLGTATTVIQDNYLHGAGIFGTTFPGINDGITAATWFWYRGLRGPGDGALTLEWTTSTGGNALVNSNLSYSWRGQAPLAAGLSVWWAWSVNTNAPSPQPPAIWQGAVTVWYDFPPTPNLG